jgi:hypothetical protein
VALLEGVLRAAVRRNGGRPFGVCRTCRHFGDDPAGTGPHYCALLRESLSEIDSGHICVEQEEA